MGEPERFKKIGTRRNLITKIQNEVYMASRYCVSPESTRALDFLLLRLAEGGNERLAISNGGCDITIKPFFQDGYPIYRREFMRKALKIHPKNTLKPVQVRLILDQDEILLSYMDGDEPRNEEIPIEGFLAAARQHPEIYSCFEGVAIRKQSGSVSHNNKQVTIGGYKKRYVIVVFNQDNDFYFDLKGEMLFETLGARELQKKAGIQNYFKVKKNAEKVTLDRLVKKLRKEFQKRWKQDQESFLKYGRTKVLEGRLKAQTDQHGYLYLRHFNLEDKIYTLKHVFNISKDYKKEPIVVNFRGPYIWVKDWNGKSIEGFVLNSPAFEYSKLRERKFEDWSFISLKERNDLEFFDGRRQISIGDYRYYLRSKERRRIESKIGKLEEFNRRAIYVCKLEEKPYCELWLMKGKRFVSVPVNVSIT